MVSLLFRQKNQKQLVIKHKEWNYVRKIILTHEKQIKNCLIFQLTRSYRFNHEGRHLFWWDQNFQRRSTKVVPVGLFCLSLYSIFIFQFKVLNLLINLKQASLGSMGQRYSVDIHRNTLSCMAEIWMDSSRSHSTQCKVNQSGANVWPHSHVVLLTSDWRRKCARRYHSGKVYTLRGKILLHSISSSTHRIKEEQLQH